MKTYFTLALLCIVAAAFAADHNRIGRGTSSSQPPADTKELDQLGRDFTRDFGGLGTNVRFYLTPSAVRSHTPTFEKPFDQMRKINGEIFLHVGGFDVEGFTLVRAQSLVAMNVTPNPQPAVAPADREDNDRWRAEINTAASQILPAIKGLQPVTYDVLLDRSDVDTSTATLKDVRATEPRHIGPVWFWGWKDNNGTVWYVNQSDIIAVVVHQATK